MPDQSEVAPEYFNEFIAAEILGVSVHTLRNDRRRNRGPRYTRFGKSVRYTRVWLRQYASQNMVDPSNAL